MKFSSTIALAAAFALGAAATQMLHAQSKPPAYEMLEIDVTNRDAYMKDYAPLAAKVIEDGGGRFLVRGGAVYASGRRRADRPRRSSRRSTTWSRPRRRCRRRPISAAQQDRRQIREIPFLHRRGRREITPHAAIGSGPLAGDRRPASSSSAR